MMESHSQQRQNFPDRNEHLCFDMESGGVRFEEHDDEEFTEYDELPKSVVNRDNFP